MAMFTLQISLVILRSQEVMRYLHHTRRFPFHPSWTRPHQRVGQRAVQRLQLRSPGSAVGPSLWSPLAGGELCIAAAVQLRGSGQLLYTNTTALTHGDGEREQEELREQREQPRRWSNRESKHRFPLKAKHCVLSQRCTLTVVCAV